MLACDFCGRSELEVFRLIQGRNKVCICDECVQLSNEIILNEAREIHKENKKKNSITENNNKEIQHEEKENI
jgi:ATP-dependent protease Clp ATPase subunit